MNAVTPTIDKCSKHHWCRISIVGLVFLAIAIGNTIAARGLLERIPEGAGVSYLNEKLTVLLHQNIAYLCLTVSAIAGLIALFKNRLRSTLPKTLVLAMMPAFVFCYLGGGPPTWWVLISGYSLLAAFCVAVFAAAAIVHFSPKIRNWFWDSLAHLNEKY